jgi:dihydroorotate dehydrogenase electron transfer subunit
LSKSFPATVVEHRDVNAGFRLLTLKPSAPALTPEPGQFYMLQANTTFDPLLKRPFSFFIIDRGTISFLYRIRGKGTQALAALGAGSSLSVIGPLGNTYPIPAGDYIAVAGGIGMASLYSLLGAAPGRATLFWGARNRNELLMSDQVQSLVQNMVITTDDGSVGQKALVTVPLKEYVTQHPHLPVYVCGSTPMMKAVAEVCAEAGTRCFVSLETYMACGVGACLGCVVKIRDDVHPEGKFRSVCKDGPVFDASTVVWDGAGA